MASPSHLTEIDFLDAVLAPIVITDHEGRVRRINRACEQVMGASPSDVRGQFVWDLFPPAEPTGEFRNAFLRGCEFEGTWQTSDGKRKTITWSATVLPECVIASANDVTGLRRAQIKFQRLIEAAPDAMVLVNQRGRISLVNAQVERLFGYRSDELVGEEIEKLVPERLRGKHLSYRRNFLTGSRVRPMGSGLDLYALHKDGHEFPVEINLSPIETEDGMLIASVIRDIGERKQLEQTILEIGEMERRRIGQDLHDGLGQHLTGVAFMGKVLADRLGELSLPEAKAATRIVELLNESIRMTRELARGLLPGAAGERGLVSALEHWAGETRDVFRIDCRFECSDPALFEGEALAEHLFRLVQEAVTNAIRHGRAKSVVIGLAAVKGGGALTIRDDGRGFEYVPGLQSGLGLRTMNYRARMIGGSLGVQSQPNGGTVVRCFFPLADRKREAHYAV
jgi:two-component system sensor kinase FixL